MGKIAKRPVRLSDESAVKKRSKVTLVAEGQRNVRVSELSGPGVIGFFKDALSVRNAV